MLYCCLIVCSYNKVIPVIVFLLMASNAKMAKTNKDFI